MKGNGDNQSKGILQTGNKQTSSKSRRISWGDIRVKEFEKNEEVNIKKPEEFNLLASQSIIQEETSGSAEMSFMDSTFSEKSKPKFKPEETDLSKLNPNNLNDNFSQSLNLNDEAQSNANQPPSPTFNPFTNNELKTRLTINNLNDLLLNEQTSTKTTQQAVHQPVQNRNNIPQNILSGNKRRTTLNLKECLENNLAQLEENDDDLVEVRNKRYTISLQDTLNLVLQKEKEEDSDETETKTVSRISASPINVKNQHILHETCLSSASRRMETTEAKNEQFPAHDRRITIMNLAPRVDISPIKTLNSMISPIVRKNKSDPLGTNDVDRRINDLLNSLTDNNKVRTQVISELQKEITMASNKLTELHEEHNRVIAKKQELKETISQLNKEFVSLKEKKQLLNFPLKVFGIKILSSELNCLTIQILNRINLSFECRGMEGIATNQMKIQKITAEILKTNANLSDKLLEKHKLMKTIYDDILNCAIKPSEYDGVPDFSNRLKLLVKYSASFLFLLELINTVLTVGMDVNLKYERHTQSVSVVFTLLNRSGYKVSFLFDIEVLNSFFGITFGGVEMSNISLSTSNYNKAQNKVMSFKEEINKFVSMKDRIRNPIFFKEFLMKLHDNILSL